MASFWQGPASDVFNVEDGQIKDSTVLQAPEHQHGAMPRFLAEQLLDALIRSANSWQEPSVNWMEKWGTIVSVIQANKMEIEGFEADLPLLNEAARNNQAVHHSRRYNEVYHPHYRIVERSIFEIELKPSLKKYQIQLSNLNLL